jgi:hypothetical protein
MKNDQEEMAGIKGIPQKASQRDQTSFGDGSKGGSRSDLEGGSSGYKLTQQDSC